jgi:hypothetical protein
MQSKPIILIPTFAFSRKSAGIYSQHKLCDMLRASYYEAFLVFVKGQPSINPDWNTPVWNEGYSEGFTVGIYSELIHGNPFRVDGIIHWTLGSALISPKRVYENDQYLYWNGHGDSKLRLNILDSNFRDSAGIKREGLALYHGKSKSWSEMGIPVVAKHYIRRFGKSAQSRQEVVDILNKVEALVISEESLIIEESILCGCPVIIRPGGYTPPDLDQIPSIYKQASDLDWPDIASLRKRIPESRDYLKTKAEASNSTFINLISALNRFNLEDIRFSQPRSSLTFTAIMRIRVLRVRSSMRNGNFSDLVKLLTDAIESRIERWKKK